MKVLLRKNIAKLGHIGEVVEVKPGYARNYLLPQQLATEPTEANLKAIEVEKQAYLEHLARDRNELEAKAAVVDGKEVIISARCNEEGHLYGSVGPAQIASGLAGEGVFIDADHIVLEKPIQQVDKYDVKIRFSGEVSATVHLWVVPLHDDGEEELPGEQSAEPSNWADEAAGEQDAATD